jgi:hypothetical protein
MERQLSGIGPVKLFLYRSLSNQPRTQIYIFLEEKKKEKAIYIQQLQYSHISSTAFTKNHNTWKEGVKLTCLQFL